MNMEAEPGQDAEKAHDLLSGPMRAAADRVRAQFEAIKRQHRGEAGRRREDEVREFLRLFLPRRLGVATSEIVASEGSVSPQTDVIIYDQMETPLLDSSESSIVVPVEGVYAVVEVASDLEPRKLEEELEKIRQVKAMPKSAYFDGGGAIEHTYRPHGTPVKRFPVLGFAFGYKGADLATLRDRLRELDDPDDLAKNLNMLCVLSRGLVLNAHPKTEGDQVRVGILRGAPEPGTQRVGIVSERHEGDGLMWFYLLMVQMLSQARTEPINMGAYLGRPARRERH
jgi:hypothetical protein